MSVGNVLVGLAEHDSAGASNYKRDPMWASQEPYSIDDVANGFRDAGKPLETPFVSRARVAALALVMLAFPLAVVALAAGLLLLMGLSVDWIQVGLIQENPGMTSGAVAMLLVSLLVLARYCTRVVADWRRRYVAVALPRKEHEVLYSFVAQVAAAVKGPVPGVIKIDNEVGLVLRRRTTRPGRHEIELVIGLPLFFSLSARQLSGLIAHAYGGFSRSEGALGYPFIANVNRWLVRMSEGDVARARDGNRPRLLANLLMPADWLVTRMFTALCRIAGFLSFSVSRGMDIQGDSYSARLGGATEFRATQIRLRALQLGKMRVLGQMEHLQDAADFEHIALRIAEEADDLQFELRGQLVREMEDLVSPFTRSRVVDMGRIVEVEKGQDEGACFLLGAAVKLLPGVEMLGQQLGARYFPETP